MASTSSPEVREEQGRKKKKPRPMRYIFIEGLRRQFWIPSEYSIQFLREDEDHRARRENHLVLSTGMMEVRLRLPIQRWAWHLMTHLHLTPIQLTPNSLRLLFVFHVQCRRHDIDPTPELLRSQFQLVRSGVSGPAVYYFKSRPNGMKITFPGRYSNHKGWQQRLFFVERSGWAEEDWGLPLRMDIRDPEKWPYEECDARTVVRLRRLSVNGGEKWLTEYKLVKKKLSRPRSKSRPSSLQLYACWSLIFWLTH